jgi:ABC-type multidrug transport system ATPase subunit/ABC-type multidrug transport system permease subunit
MTQSSAPHDESNSNAYWVIGRAEDCGLVVPEPAVSGHHCRLTRHANGFKVEDLHSANGTYVNGVRITPGEPVWVSLGAHVTLGSRVAMPWPPMSDSAPPPPRVRTVVSDPPKPGGARTITIGRDPESDVQIDLPIVSWNHARITVEKGQYILEDCNSRNGTSIGELSNRIQRAVLDPSSDVFLGSYKIPATQLLSHEKKVEIGEAAFHKVKFSGNTMEIGRDPQCDVPLAFPMVSWRHARFTRAPEGILVEDLDSRNGTYVDGIRVSGKVLVKPGQEIGLGSFRFQLLAGGELAQREYYGNVTIEASDIVVLAPNGKRLLDPISLTVFPSELVALMGPAGAGKTTLLKALNGYTRPVEGQVLFNGYSLYDYYDRFRQQMGYVPQDDIVHPQLTVRQALYFSARLRTDLNDSEIDARTEKVLHDLGIPDKIDTVIGSPERKTLSGGQRKRVNIALELITDTPLLFLDEPTSGLSSYDAESVVDLLKDLSKTGKTIITTIHQPSLKVYKQFDDLLMVSRDRGDSPGALVFFGPAFPDSIQFFNSPASAPSPFNTQSDLNPEMLFSGMNRVPEANRTQTWRKRFQASRYQQEFVAGRSGKQPAAGGKTGEETPRRQFSLVQWFALVRRNVIVKMQDRAQTAILLLQAPLFALLVALINYPLQADRFDELVQKLPIIHFLMVVAAIWFGCNNAARDIVGEWTIYKRERMVTLKLIPYVFSKLAVLLGLCIFQCGSLLAIVYLACGLHSNFLEDFLVLLVASMIGAGLGLCISALSKTNESAIALLPVVLLPIIALGGGMRPIYLMPKAGQFISTVIPSRWSYEANLLHEAAASDWGSKKLLPDLRQGCAPTPPAAPSASLPPAASTPPPALPLQGADCPANDDSALCGDAAENSIPHYLITFTDDKGKEQTCRASANQSYPPANPTAFAFPYRHRFRDSMAVLASMLFLLVGAVLVILRKRDTDPQ